MTEEEKFDLIVIGGGPAGYVGAIRGAQLGMKVACVDSRKTLGGTCLNVGCIPSKALLQSSEAYVHTRDSAPELGVTTGKVGFDLEVMQARKNKVVESMTVGIEGLFKKHGIAHFVGHGSFIDSKTVKVAGDEDKVIVGENVLVASGSVPIELPAAPFDEKYVLSSTGALALEKVPKKMVVVGGGVIGLELGSVWARLGSEVTIVEFMPTILANMDEDVVRAMKKMIKRLGIKVYGNSRFEGFDRKGVKLSVSCSNADGPFEIPCNALLVAVGRRANSQNLNLEGLGIEVSANGKIPVNPSFQTAVSNVYAVGDVIEGPMLAHKAEEEAVACVENIAGIPGHVNYEAIPNVVYTWPEVASVGKTVQECKELGLKVKVGKFPFTANGRAKASGETEGFVKTIADSETDRLIGVHIVGANASELIAEVAIAFEYKASAEDIARSVHAHPTMSEAIKESCLAVDKRTINM